MNKECGFRVEKHGRELCQLKFFLPLFYKGAGFQQSIFPYIITKVGKSP
jgi:hypothetical protein